jgi:homoserine dehydrogenase
MKKTIMLAGYGHVGREFGRLLAEKSADIKDRYNLDFKLVGVYGKEGCLYEPEGIHIPTLLECGTGSEALNRYSKAMHLPIESSNFKADVLVEATPTNVDNGGPGLVYITNAIENQMDVVAISKGALVKSFKQIMEAARAKNVKIKYSGATAAALPTLDIGEFSLAGSEIRSIEGILNGTTNYILTCMHEDDLSYQEALLSAQEKGIAETNPDLDVKGIDSACKIMLLSNCLLGTNYSLQDVSIVGIDKVTKEEIQAANDRGMKVKLIAKAIKVDDQVHISVSPCEISPDHLLAGVKGTNKGVMFNTDTMGSVSAIGGASNPRGAAAAALKDLINIYRTN